jgi:agmatinase
VIPVPWEVTVSYGTGTASAPAAVLAASSQVDLENETYPDAWKRGIAMAPEPPDVRRLNDTTRPKALDVIDTKENAGASLVEVNRACDTMVAKVRADAAELLDRGKRVAVLGGDHSVALGLMQALAERHNELGILHIDAHCDLRDAYEGFRHSHASIMRNALGLSGLSKLIQVGVRDYCEEELGVIQASGGVVRLFSDHALARRRFDGETWSRTVDDIVRELPENVYVSFDVDGLDPSLCPGTGTPVPGGLAYEQALFLVERLTATKRTIIGFDLCEVSPSGERGSEWDANVGARLLYRLSSATLSR